MAIYTTAPPHGGHPPLSRFFACLLRRQGVEPWDEVPCQSAMSISSEAMAMPVNQGVVQLTAAA